MVLKIVYVVTAVLSGFVTAGISLIYFAYRAREFMNKISKIEEDIHWIQNIRTRLSDIEDSIPKKINSLENYNVPQKGKSPFCLLERAKIILFESSGLNYIVKNKKSLLDEIKSKNLKKNYDEFIFAEDLLNYKSNFEGFNKIKEYAFKESMEIGIIIKIMACQLMDWYHDD